MRVTTNPAVAQLLSNNGELGAPIATPGGHRGPDFGSMLMDVLKEVNTSQQEAASIQDDLFTNRRPVEYHDVMIAVEKASTTMQLTMAVRNKLLEAYQEINRMQV